MNLKQKLPWLGVDSFEEGMYDEAAKQGKSLTQWLEDKKCNSDGLQSPYYGKTTGEILQMQARLRKAGKEVPLTAFEFALKGLNVNAFGANADPLKKLYEYSDSATLIPEILGNRVYAAAIKASLVGEFVAEDTVINSTTFQKVYISDSEAERQTSVTMKGEELPEIRISVSEQNIYLTKHGADLQVAYEDVNMVPLNLFGVVLDRIGLQIGVDETDDMFSVAINGDGNSNTPGTTVESDTSGSIVMQDAIAWATGLPTPYKMNKMVGKKALLQKYLTALLGVGVNAPPETLSSIGVLLPPWHEWDRSIITSDYFLGFDTRFALGRVSSGAVMTETGKIIRKQLNETTISLRSAFHVIDNQAIAIFDETH